jgi:hypothetical protein
MALMIFKNRCRNNCATQLSELSKLHEIAGLRNDLAFILDNVDLLLSVYDDILNNIKTLK